jgi:hypothetical protein
MQDKSAGKLELDRRRAILAFGLQAFLNASAA